MEDKAVKISFIVTVLIASLLGIIALGLNPYIGHSNLSSRLNCTIAFNIIGVILLLGAAIAFLVLMFAQTGRGKLLLIITFILTAVGFICYAISSGCVFGGSTDFAAWILSATWASVASVVLAILFFFFYSEM
ncbi:unnamed protein product [Dicrocoelium dendriticum]|nr:unnamed protein product [Dicrocoelium dendriticum]